MRPRRLPALLLAILTLATLTVAFGPAADALPGNGVNRAAANTPKVEDYFTPAEIARARKYNGPRYAIGLASMLVGLAVLAILGLGRTTRGLGTWAEKTTGGRWALTTIVLAGAVTLVPAIVTLPFSIWRGLYHERSFGLSTQSLGGFLADSAKADVFQAVLTAAAALGFFAIARRLPKGWPFAAGGFLIVLTVLLVVVYPLVYEPLFNKFTPVDAATKDRIVRLAQDAGVKVDKVLVADASRRTTKQNAYVSGLGSTKRVVLYDTLLQKSTPKEVDLVVAHELGHVVHKDVLRGTLLACVGAAGAVAIAWFFMRSGAVQKATGAGGAADPRSLPFLVLVLSVATIVTLPLVNGLSRRMEAGADRFAVQRTHDSRTAVQVEVNLAKDNVSDLQPNGFIVWMFFTHPPVMERIRTAVDQK